MNHRLLPLGLILALSGSLASTAGWARPAPVPKRLKRIPTCAEYFRLLTCWAARAPAKDRALLLKQRADNIRGWNRSLRRHYSNVRTQAKVCRQEAAVLRPSLRRNPKLRTCLPVANRQSLAEKLVRRYPALQAVPACLFKLRSLACSIQGWSARAQTAALARFRPHALQWSRAIVSSRGQPAAITKVRSVCESFRTTNAPEGGGPSSGFDPCLRRRGLTPLKPFHPLRGAPACLRYAAAYRCYVGTLVATQRRAVWDAYARTVGGLFAGLTRARFKASSIRRTDQFCRRSLQTFHRALKSRPAARRCLNAKITLKTLIVSGGFPTEVSP